MTNGAIFSNPYEGLNRYDAAIAKSYFSHSHTQATLITKSLITKTGYAYKCYIIMSRSR
jgi:hypothetical protein